MAKDRGGRAAVPRWAAETLALWVVHTYAFETVCTGLKASVLMRDFSVFIFGLAE